MAVITEILNLISQKNDDLQQWMLATYSNRELPLYSSVDVRDSGFKLSVVDTNLFPAGFNNLSNRSLDFASKIFQETILSRLSGCKRILIITEEHTRNTWYLENVFVLSKTIQAAGFEVCLASFLDVETSVCDTFGFVELETAVGNTVRIHCLKDILSKFISYPGYFDMVILNNDLSTGVPDVLKQSKIPIYPPLHAGWHKRLKSHHFLATHFFVEQVADILGCDPWLLSCYFDSCSADITLEEDRHMLADKASDLFRKIQIKYDSYGIKEAPYIFLKSNSGTYGMGVQAIASPEDILSLNRKSRNNLSVGKGSQKIHSFILQEGVRTDHRIGDMSSEICLYQVANTVVGGFYRVNSQKSDRDNLNSQGMGFKKICCADLDPHLHKKYVDCLPPHPHIRAYQLLAQIAAIAACKEINELENT